MFEVWGRVRTRGQHVPPGTPRVARCGTTVSARKEAVARASSVVSDYPATNRATTLLVRRWDTGTPWTSRCPRRPGFRKTGTGAAALTGNRDQRNSSPKAKPDSVWWLFGALGGIVGSRHRIVVKEDSLAGGLEVIHLTAPHRPDEGDDACDREQQGDGEGDVDNGHEIIMNYEL